MSFSRAMQAGLTRGGSGAALLLGMNDGGDDTAKINALMGGPTSAGPYYARGGYDIWTSGFDFSNLTSWNSVDAFFYPLANAAVPKFKKTFALSPGLCPAGGDMASAGNGTYDAKYTAQANAIISGNNSIGANTPTLIRPAAELTGTWFPWSVGSGTANATYANFILAWNRFVACYRAAATAAGKSASYFKFDWNLAIWPSSPNPTLYYPGDSTVDFIGADFYLESALFSGLTGTDAQKSQQMFDKLKDGTAFNTYGLDWLEAYATSKGKPMAFWEWCAGGKTPAGYPTTSAERVAAEDFQTRFAPYLIPLIASWMSTRNVAYECYWNSDEGFYGAFNSVTAVDDASGNHHGTAAMAAVKAAYDAYFPLIPAGRF